MGQNQFIQRIVNWTAWRIKSKQTDMKIQTYTNQLLGSGLALVLILAVCSPAQAQSSLPTQGEDMMGGSMMQNGKSMQEQRRAMLADMKTQDAQLTEQITAMNSAPEDKKLDLMTAVVTQMVAQRTAMNARMVKMQEGMMMNRPMGIDSMSQHSMMQGIKEQRRAMMADMKTQDAQLTEQITAMNSAPEGKKLDLMATIVTQMATQRTSMNARMGKMQEEMMDMSMDKDSTSQDSMMKGMQDKSGNALEDQK
jgi:hypothetical protein